MILLLHRMRRHSVTWWTHSHRSESPIVLLLLHLLLLLHKHRVAVQWVHSVRVIHAMVAE